MQAELEDAREQLFAGRGRSASITDRAAAALAYAREHKLTASAEPDTATIAGGPHADTGRWDW